MAYEMFPITMPYMPGKPIEVYCEDFLTDKKNGDFDTVGVFYALKTEDGKREKIEINRFFREPEGDEEGNWTEMDVNEFHGNATLVYDEPLNTPEMISRAERDIKHLINNGDVTIEHDSVSIIFFKRIKENRVEVQ